MVALTRINDRIAGAFVMTFGLAVAGYTTANMDLGTLRNLGPGGFPLILGSGLAILGAIVLGTAIRDGRKPPDPEREPEHHLSVDLGSVLYVNASIAVFALLINPFGLVPATIAQVFIAGVATKALDWKKNLLLSVLSAVFATILFKFVLKTPIEVIHWPFGAGK